MASQILGKVSVVPKGQYDNSATYDRLDIVTYNGESYIAKGTTTGNLPTNTQYWQVLVNKPVRGTDYWTNADKEEIVGDVITDITPTLNQKADKSEIPDELRDLTDDSTHRLVTDTEKATWNAKSDFSGNYNDLTNKPSIPTKTSDLTNDSNFAVDSNYVHTDNNFTTEEKTKLAGLSNYDDTQIQAKVTQAQTTANTAKSIAEGANQALSYNNYSSMITAVNAFDDDKFNVGQNIMIVTLEVPDLWVSGIESTSSTYLYTTDVAFISELETNGYVKVGYYKLSALETQKVDLTDYAKTTDIPTTLAELSDDSTHRLVTDTEKTTWNAKGTYSKPTGGIPKTDLDSSVQASLDKADTALQTHQDISGKQDVLVAGTNISIAADGKTISATDTTYSDATTSTAGLMSATDKTKLNGIASGAEVNVQSNWNETNTSSDSYIQNKPTIPTVNNSTITIQMNGSTVDSFTTNASSAKTIDLGTVITSHQDISGKLDTSKVKNATSTTAGDVYDVRYINTMLGDIETILTTLTTGSGV